MTCVSGDVVRVTATAPGENMRKSQSAHREVVGLSVATETGQQEQMQQLLAGLTAVRGGDFSIRLPEGADPLMNDIAAVFNGMNEQLGVFTSEVTRVAREVGTEGQLGGQADVQGVSGTWKDLTDPVNAMAGH